MPKLTLKQELEAKITDVEQYRAILARQGFGLSPGFGHVHINGSSHRQQWWGHREYLRISSERYAMSTALTNLNATLPIFSHVSVLDPKRVAYTPDKVSGEADRQVVTTLGKLLTKFYPALADEVIQKIVAEHEGEISDEVEFIEYEGIAEAYQDLGSTGACMSKKPEEYGGLNPILAICKPGVRLAVMRTPDGKISARSLVYEASLTDLRLIRAYGNQALLGRLTRRGYTPGTWEGFQFIKIPHPEKQQRYDRDCSGSANAKVFSFPYLDGMNTVGTSEHSMVALLDGVLTSVSRKMSDSLRKINLQAAVCATSTGGGIALVNTDMSALKVVDYITGAMINSLDDDFTEFYVDQMRRVTKEPLPREAYVKATCRVAGSRVSRLMPVTETFADSGTRYEIASAESLGFRQLDALLYPNADYVSEYSVYLTTSGKVIRRSDSVRYITKNEHFSSYIHKSELNFKGKEKDFRLKDGVYAKFDVPTFITPSGRKVVPGVHDVKKLYNGMYDFNRNIIHVTILNKTYCIPKDGTVKYNEGSDLWKTRRDELFTDVRNAYARGDYEFSTPSGMAARTLEWVSGQSFRNRYDYGVTARLDSKLPIRDQLVRMNTIAKVMITAGYPEFGMATYLVKVQYAEMEAVEAPAYLPYVEPAVLVEIPDMAAVMVSANTTPADTLVSA